MGLEPGSCFSLACLYIFGKSVNDACSAPQYCSEYIAHMYIRFSELSPSEQTPKWNHSTKWRKPSVPRSIFIQKGNLLLRNLGCKNSKKDGNSKSFLSQAFSQTPILHKMLINRKSLALDWVSSILLRMYLGKNIINMVFEQILQEMERKLELVIKSLPGFALSEISEFH